MGPLLKMCQQDKIHDKKGGRTAEISCRERPWQTCGRRACNICLDDLNSDRIRNRRNVLDRPQPYRPKRDLDLAWMVHLHAQNHKAYLET